MALIKVKRRSDAIRISNERARELKVLLHGDPITQTQPAPATDRVDLGEWAGQISEIVGIEFDLLSKKVSIEFTESDLRKTAEEISKFKPKKFPPPPGGLVGRTVPAIELYMESRGVVNMSQYGYISVTDPKGFDAIENRYEEIVKRQGKKEYAIRKSTEELSKGMSIKK